MHPHVRFICLAFLFWLALSYATTTANDAQQKESTRAEGATQEMPKHHADSQARRGGKSEHDRAGGDDEQGGHKEEKKPPEEPPPVVTRGSVTVHGKELAYTATAGKMVMKTDAGSPKANVFFVAYTKDDSTKEDRQEQVVASGRPITFCFNGGPGSSSVWLHLGMLGPKRVKLDSDAGILAPPHALIPNEYSLLDVSDLVFIDPVSTGFSRPIEGEDKRQFHGYDEDLKSVAQFIHDYTTKYGRWHSPKFLLGESYGGLRAAGLSGVLQQRYRMYLNGIVLVSAVVDFQTLMAHGNNDIAYALFLPSFTATAWYHQALSAELQGKSLEEIVRESQKFAMGPYLRALAAGDSLPKKRRQKIVQRMSELTGLSPEYLEAADLRVSMPRFGKELLRSKHLIVGRFDSRYTGISLDPLTDTTDYDPSGSAVFGTFTSALNDYMRQELKVKEERVYEILTDQVYPWDYSEFTNRFVDASATLRQAMTQNQHLRVFAACGYFDLATPAVAMEYTRDHLNLAPALRANFQMGFYKAGHMMYVHEPSLRKLREDLVQFYESALNADTTAR